MEKNGRIGGLFVRLFTESRSLSRDALEILLASQEWKQGKSLVGNTLSFITNQSFFCTLYVTKKEENGKI